MVGNSLSHFGATYSYRRRYYHETLALPSSVKALEVLVDHFLPLTKERQYEIASLRDRFVLLPHSLEASLGSSDGLQLQYIKNIHNVLKLMCPPFWSDHVAFTRIGRRKVGHLAPVPRSNESLGVLTKNILEVQQYIDYQIILENISCPFAFGNPEMSEVDFLTQICESTHVELLLDLSNLLSSQTSPETIIRTLDPKYVRALHLGGGDFYRGTYLDLHDRPVSDTVWNLLSSAFERFTPSAVIIEWDICLPPFEDLYREIQRAQVAYTSVLA